MKSSRRGKISSRVPKKWQQSNWHKELQIKENEKGSNAHEKSLIWATKDTEWTKLEERELFAY